MQRYFWIAVNRKKQWLWKPKAWFVAVKRCQCERPFRDCTMVSRSLASRWHTNMYQSHRRNTTPFTDPEGNVSERHKPAGISGNVVWVVIYLLWNALSANMRAVFRTEQNILLCLQYLVCLHVNFLCMIQCIWQNLQLEHTVWNTVNALWQCFSTFLPPRALIVHNHI